VKLTTEEAMKNPRLWAAIEKVAKKPPSAAQEARSMIQGVNPAFPLVPAKAKGRKKPGIKSKLEAEYEQFLEGEKRAGRILEYQYEAWAFKIANKTWYHPDFIVLTAAYFLEVHEVKAHWRMFQNDMGRVKIKAAARLNWWVTFKVAMKRKKKDGGGWKIEEIPGA
jgi:hypothetical protein